MPVYSVVISDEQLLEIAQNGYKHVSILACPGCINESISFVSDLPIMHKENEIISYPAIEKECNRIKDLLQSVNVISDFSVIPSDKNIGCIVNLSRPIGELPISSECDAILLFSCPSRYPIVKKQTELPIYVITKQLGMLSYTYSDDGIDRKIIDGRVHSLK